jgi:Nitronate monooxygenase
MLRESALVRRLGIEHPIIQAPMAGGATTVDLVAAVCRARALGFLGCAYSSPEVIRETAAAVRARTDRPFGLNLFAPQPTPDASGDAGRMVELLQGVHAELSIAPPSVPAPSDLAFVDQLEAVLETDASVFSFTFGLLPPGAVEEIKARGLIVIGTATTVDEAVALESAGVDAIVAQGSEAGAHRGTFGPSFEAAMTLGLAEWFGVLDATVHFADKSMRLPPGSRTERRRCLRQRSTGCIRATASAVRRRVRTKWTPTATRAVATHAGLRSVPAGALPQFCVAEKPSAYPYQPSLLQRMANPRLTSARMQRLASSEHTPSSPMTHQGWRILPLAAFAIHDGSPCHVVGSGVRGGGPVGWRYRGTAGTATRTVGRRASERSPVRRHPRGCRGRRGGLGRASVRMRRPP